MNLKDCAVQIVKLDVRDLCGPVEGDWCVMLVGGHERAPEVDDAEAQSLEAAHVPHAAAAAA